MRSSYRLVGLLHSPTVTASVVAQRRGASRVAATALYSIAARGGLAEPRTRVSAVPVTIAGA